MMTTFTLSKEEQIVLQAIAHHTGKTEYELVHEALSQLIFQFQTANRRSLLQQARGMWRDREDVPDVAVLRREFDRREPK